MKKFFVAFTAVLVLGIFGFTGVLSAFTETGLKATADNAGLSGLTSVSDVTGNVIGTALSMVAVLFFGLMIYAGIMWMVDRGNEERSKKALDTITAAVIGLIIVLSSYAITKFAFGSVSGTGGGAGGTPTVTSTATR